MLLLSISEFLRELFSLPLWLIFIKIIWFLFTLYVIFLLVIMLWFHLWYRFSTDKETRERDYKRVGYDPKKDLPWWGWLILFAFTAFLHNMLFL